MLSYTTTPGGVKTPCHRGDAGEGGVVGGRYLYVLFLVSDDETKTVLTATTYSTTS
jgi:hypothetical protein